MVTLLTKGLQNKGLDYGICNTFNPELHNPKKMSKGPTLFSCGVMDGDRWRDLRKCQIELEQSSSNLDPPWTCLTGSEECQESGVWSRDANTAGAVTSLIKDLSLSDRNGNPSAPPSKRQCRSLSFSDELSSCRSPWKPSGSKVWTAVDKRRCHSGGSVQRCSNGVSTIQRSSSFSLPSRSNVFSLSCDPAAPSSRSACPQGQGIWVSPACAGSEDLLGGSSPGDAYRADLLRPLSLSHEQISVLEFSLPSTPTSAAQLAQQTSRLLRCRSQPCVLNDQKIGMKRRRQEQIQEQRPSLDLAKMTQNLRNFHSLSSLGSAGDDCCQQQGQPASRSVTTTKKWTPSLCDSAPMPGTTPACSPELQHHENVGELATSVRKTREEGKGFGAVKESCQSEENEKDTWRKGESGQDTFQLDCELDIEQIENN
ncbi:LOW QUALITY PROTEIN: protein FAM53B [Callorhinchus milii]|uniref:LOW QUALITY PROTEIN: protein FAM53B n=1 Tax=Callorhinchus milii TaxID=7868 RepID=UPI001C3FB87F|nr:LOW QUALITY PROTEIN: protein FAM53B [Callorhinchus milii]